MKGARAHVEIISLKKEEKEKSGLVGFQFSCALMKICDNEKKKVSGGKRVITFLIKGIYLILKKKLQAFKVFIACATQRDH